MSKEFRKETSETSRDPLGKGLSINPRIVGLFFTLLLLLIVGVQLFLTPRYRSQSQIFPIVIGIPTFILLVGHLLIQISPSTQAFIEENLSASKVIEIDDRFEEVQDQARDENDWFSDRKSVLKMFLWMLFFIMSVLIFGFLPGLFLFLILYYRYYARATWARTIAYSIGLALFIAIVFNVVLNTRFPQGILGLSSVFPL